MEIEEINTTGTNKNNLDLPDGATDDQGIDGVDGVNSYKQLSGEFHTCLL